MGYTESLSSVRHLLDQVRVVLILLLTGLSLAVFVCSCKIYQNIAAQSEGFAGVFFCLLQTAGNTKMMACPSLLNKKDSDLL